MGAVGAVGATQDVPGPRPAERAEIVHTRITRLLVSGRPVVRKEPLGPDAERRLRREMGILERVRGVDGVAQLMLAPAVTVLGYETVGHRHLAEALARDRQL